MVSTAAATRSGSGRQPEVVETGGTVPAFENRSVLFIANLLSLFFGNDQETRELEREVRGAETYGGRLVPILNLLFTGGANRLVLEAAPSDALIGYFESDLGLGMPSIAIATHREYTAMTKRMNEHEPSNTDKLFDALASSGTNVVDGYVTDETLATIAGRLGLSTLSSQEGSRRGNNKLLLHQALEAAGLPVFETRLAESAVDVHAHIQTLRSLGFRSVGVKAQLGASGIGILKIGADDPVEIPDMMFNEGPCMVQGWLEPGVRDVSELRSPSVQLFLDDDRVCLYDVTEQILSEQSIHQGNESPPSYLGEAPGLRAELSRQAGVAGSWLHDQGYRGTASVDFLVAFHENGDQSDVRVCEINARVTGATYPSVLARHFNPSGAWLMRNVRLDEPFTDEALLEKLRSGNSLFDGSKPGGVLPINFNTGADGRVHKGQFLCLADTVADCAENLRRAQVALGIRWQYERD